MAGTAAIERRAGRWLVPAIAAALVAAIFMGPGTASAAPTCTTVCYVDAAAGNDANDGTTAGTALKTIQAGINQVSAGGQVRVLPGSYTESAPGSAPTSLGGVYQFGLFFHSSKPGITVLGVTAADVPITDAGSTLATITTNATNNFGPSGVFVEAANTTIKGVKIGDNLSGTNKTIEVVADGFRLEDSVVDVTGGGSVYINDFSAAGNIVQSYAVVDSRLLQGTSIDLASGAGLFGAAANRLITGNTFVMGPGDYWPVISFSGSGTGVPWFVNSVGGAVITGNSFSGGEQYIRARGTYDNSQFDWESYWSDNTYDKAVVALVSEAPFDVRTYSYTSAPYIFNDVRRIGAIIQGEIDHAQPGDTVLVKTGSYAENLVVPTPLTLKGGGQGATILRPAVSAANPCVGSSTCGGAASNVVLVQASDVTITELTVDGTNPALGPGIHARNGIITNHAGSGYPGSGVFNNLEVAHVTVQNIYLRGVYASSGGTFNIHDNMVTNVKGDAYAIAMFNFGGAGTFANNTVSDASDGIAANWSRGTTFTGNTVTDSGSGIHTDNAGGGALPGDLISDNSVTACKPDGYGIWTFVQYSAATVEDNTVSGCTVGLGAFGGAFSGPTVTTVFAGNVVDGQGAAGSIGALIQTGTWGYGNTAVAASFEGNTITGFETGVYVDDSDDPYEGSDTSGPLATVTLHRNSIAGNADGISNDGAATVNATCNWYGEVSGPSGEGPGGGDSVSAGVTFLPWLLAASPLATAPCGTYDETVHVSGRIDAKGKPSVSFEGKFEVEGGIVEGWLKVSYKNKKKCTFAPDENTTYTLAGGVLTLSNLSNSCEAGEFSLELTDRSEAPRRGAIALDGPGATYDIGPGNLTEGNVHFGHAGWSHGHHGHGGHGGHGNNHGQRNNRFDASSLLSWRGKQGGSDH